jgi:hypothetical protein
LQLPHLQKLCPDVGLGLAVGTGDQVGHARE